MVASPSATIVTYLLALTNFDAFALRGVGRAINLFALAWGVPLQDSADGLY
jgi:hypothetical protein